MQNFSLFHAHFYFIVVTLLEEVVSFQPVDIKKLQLRLQGSVLVTVNAGSMAYAYAFLAHKDEKIISAKGRLCIIINCENPSKSVHSNLHRLNGDIR